MEDGGGGGGHGGRTLVAHPLGSISNNCQLFTFNFHLITSINYFPVQACVPLYWPVDVFNYCRVLPSNQLP